MTESEKIIFEEKQYLGTNRNSLFRRLLMALLCFVAYYWSENPKPVDVSGIRIGSYPVEEIPNSGELFFLMGLFILLFSGALVFLVHIKTTITESSITLDGLWTSRKVKIALSNIIQVKKINFNKNILSRPTYNLHNDGVISFFSSGQEAIELIDKEGLKYHIGTQRANELLQVIETSIGNEKN